MNISSTGGASLAAASFGQTGAPVMRRPDASPVAGPIMRRPDASPAASGAAGSLLDIRA